MHGKAQYTTKKRQIICTLKKYDYLCPNILKM